jgi:hypothetical protein
VLRVSQSSHKSESRSNRGDHKRTGLPAVESHPGQGGLRVQLSFTMFVAGKTASHF